MYIHPLSSSGTHQATTANVFVAIEANHTRQLIAALGLKSQNELDDTQLFFDHVEQFIYYIKTDSGGPSNTPGMGKFIGINNLVFLCMHTGKKITKEQLDKLLSLQGLHGLSSFESYYWAICFEYYGFLTECIDIDQLITYFGIEAVVQDIKTLFHSFLAYNKHNKLFHLGELINSSTLLREHSETIAYQSIITLIQSQVEGSDTLHRSLPWNKIYSAVRMGHITDITGLNIITSHIKKKSIADCLKKLAQDEITSHYYHQLHNVLGYRMIYLGQASVRSISQNIHLISDKTLISNISNDVHTTLQKIQNVVDDDNSATIVTNLTTQIQRFGIELKEIIDNQIIRIYEKPTQGLYSVGGKIHLRESIPTGKIPLLNNKYISNIGGFSTIHADQTINLPAVYKAKELHFILTELIQDGMIPEDAELQICIPGRLPNRLAGMLGSSILLLTDRCVEYTPESFQTKAHNHLTGAKIMAYDAGVLDTGFVFNTGTLVGRTDMLGRKSIIDIYHYQIIGSLLSQSIYGGMFHQLGKQFIEDYETLLKQYSLEDLINKQRIYDSEHDTLEDAKTHHELIKHFTTIRHNDRISSSPTSTLTYKLKVLLKKYIELLLSID
ncbi:MAG TPA: hypothetical protein PLW93_01695 [Candidatus Absconditabacterales bacterium]|nr:hypothetical protein [Candidatus Absconditabacterales bacterium]HNG96964.1 hypothetical protein [Candidatus Absconditabacterales bacterium]